MKDAATPHARVVEGYVKDTDRGWELSVSGTGFEFLTSDLASGSHVEFSGKVTKVENETDGTTWCEVASSYFSGRYGSGEGEWKERTAKVKLDKPWKEGELRGKKLSVDGVIAMEGEGRDRTLYIDAAESVLIT